MKKSANNKPGLAQEKWFLVKNGCTVYGGW
jgi:hypothetical protein